MEQIRWVGHRMLIRTQYAASLSRDEIEAVISELRGQGWEKITYTVRQDGEWKEYQWYGQQPKH